MIGQYDNLVMTSFLLWLDNKVTNQCQAYTNFSGNLYKVSGQFANTYAYGAPAQQIVYDSSVSGANVITGVYLNNVFIGSGTSGFLGINYEKGHALFSTNVNSYTISGYFAVKDFNIKMTAEQDETLLFKTKYQLKPKFPQVPTGVPPGYAEFPLIYVREGGKYNDPFALGGLDQTYNIVRCVIISDSLFSLHAVQSVLVDTVRTPIALFNANEGPFNSLGSLISGVYNYTGAAYNKINAQNFVFIEDVRAPNQGQRIILNNFTDSLPRDCYINFVDFTLTRVRQPRLNIN